jgi:hypothetical protein
MQETLGIPRCAAIGAPDDPGSSEGMNARQLVVDRTRVAKDQIKNAPEYDEDQNRDESYRDDYRNRLGSYYGTGGAGYRDDDLR